MLYPLRYAEIEQMVATQAPEREEFLDAVLTDLRARLDELKIEADVKGRPKHYWSIYEKMITRGKQFDDVQDLVGVRVVVESVKDCYAALGSIHAMWKPVQGRFKDYIAMPKFNLYQSLHTTVVGPSGKAVEVQIRTQEMHRRAEFGVAAHWGYKEREPAEDLLWLQRMVDWQQETSDPGEFMEALKIDLEYDEVFVFTPKGKVITLAAGATPVDFAYAIHTDVGHRCIGARVNGRLVPLDSGLASGDTIEIFTSKVRGRGPVAATGCSSCTHRRPAPRSASGSRVSGASTPSTPAARSWSRPSARRTCRSRSSRGSTSLNDVAVAMHYADVDALHAAIGENHVSAKAVVQRLSKELRSGEEQLPVTTARPPERARTSERRATGVHVEGLDDVMVRLSRCCTPVPGDEIMGFVTRGRGVSVHRTDCANAAGLVGHAERVIEVEWDHDQPATFVVSVEVEALDRSRLLRDVADVLAEHHVNILSCTSQTSNERVAKFRFDFELADPEPPRVDPLGDQARRQRLRRVPGAPGPRQGPRELARTRMAEGELSPEEVRRVTELLERVVADPSILQSVAEQDRIRFVNAAGDVFCPDVDERRRRTKARQRRERSETLGRDEARARGAPASAACAPSRCSRRPTCSRPRGSLPMIVSARITSATTAGNGCSTRSTATCARPSSATSTTSTTSSARRARRSTTAKRTETADLRGRVALLTGGRVEDRLPGGHQAAARRGAT